ncbi:hypothetical protein FRB90_000643, partial [Tulasnella sp. 427]
MVRKKCELKGCEKPSLDSAANVKTLDGTVAEGGGVPAVCDGCGGAFCVTYVQGEPKAHKCIPKTAVVTEDKNATAKALLAKAFPKSATASSAASPPTGSETSDVVQQEGSGNSMPPMPKSKDPAKEAQLRKVELMKMRQKAVPVESQFTRSGSTVPSVDNRRFFNARDAGAPGNPSVAYWATKDVIAGKVLDRLVTLLKVASNADGYKLEVQGANVERKNAELSRPIGEQMEDGDTLVVVGA